jgi:hypothetical protein
VGGDTNVLLDNVGCTPVDPLNTSFDFAAAGFSVAAFGLG